MRLCRAHRHGADAEARGDGAWALTAPALTALTALRCASVRRHRSLHCSQSMGSIHSACSLRPGPPRLAIEAWLEPSHWHAISCDPRRNAPEGHSLLLGCMAPLLPMPPDLGKDKTGRRKHSGTPEPAQVLRSCRKGHCRGHTLRCFGAAP